ncbi:MAG: right-handed parallel beta-helix repeat-containing protein [Planctomycetota bacterium]|nr:right-handed parallel beta-helix repeat-containing protein [Planctomycetota bacterium]
MVGPKISKASLAAAIVVVALQTSVMSAIITVPGDQPSIQAGIDAADPGDEVVVAEGTYFENINFNGKAITVRSTDPTDPAVVANTIIDGGGSGSVVTCNSSEGPDTVLSGFYITNGLALYGGGMKNQGTSPTVTYCTFDGNLAIENGGGMDNNNSSPMVSHCTFSQDTAEDVGGGIACSNSNTTIIGCTFQGNLANGGGGMGLFGGSVSVVGCRFLDNVVNYDGSGVNCQGSTLELVNTEMWNNTGGILGSMGATVFSGYDASVNLTNCTIADNSGNVAGGVGSYESTTTVANCILWDNAPAQIVHSGSGSMTVSYSDVQGGYSGTGNIDRDPLFVDGTGGDWRLLNCSPVADAGINSAVPGGVTIDLDGNPRFVDDAGISDTGFGDPPVIDMGAYERQTDSPAGIINVPADYATIQAAIDAICGGEVVVAPGTYFESINFNGKAITVRSTDPTDPDVVARTIINGGASGSVVTCASGEGPDTQLSGLTITNGNASYSGGMSNDSTSPTVTNCSFIGNSANLGGGMFNFTSSPTVTNCTFSGNVAYDLDGGGAGMYNENSSPTVTNCTFSGNTADFWGGGMFNLFSSNPTVTDCTFSGNSATFKGGGMFNFISSPTVTNCTFSGNETIDQDGGGMYNELVSNPAVAKCTFSGNTAEFSGGGMYNSGSSPTVTDCIFNDNTAAVGGGMMNLSGSSPTVTNCTFSGNTGSSTGGGGMSNWYDSSPTVTNCTFSGNTAGYSGGGMYNYGNTSNPTVTNCILWNNVPNEISDDVGSTTTASYSDISGGFPGAGNIDADPMFLDPDNGDFRLSSGSPCIDAGDNTAVPVDITTDLDGHPRFVDDPIMDDTGLGDCLIVDMGSYEFQEGTPECCRDCPTDDNDDGDTGPIDLATLLGAWGSVEDATCLDANGDGDIGPFDLATLLGTWGPCQ